MSTNFSLANRPRKPRAAKRGTPAQHSAICTVCKHLQKNELEQRYAGFEHNEKIAAEFGVSKDAVYRHALYFGLDRKRVADTENVLLSIIARGFKQLSKADGRLLSDSIKEFNRITGKHKEPAANPHDLARRAFDTLRDDPDNAHLDDAKLQAIVSKIYGVTVSELVM